MFILFKGLLTGSAFLVFFILGLFQLFGVLSFFDDYLGWNFIISIILGFFVSNIPIIGTVLGILGMKFGFGWEWWQAILLYCWGFIPFILTLFPTLRDKGY